MGIKVINNVDLDDLDLSIRAWNCLRRAMINNVQDIVDNIENLPRVRNLGQKCYNEVLEKIKPYIEEVDKICITNYDRIKQMSIEEMATMLDNFRLNCSYCPACDFCNESFKDKKCRDIVKLWLEQEAEK